MKVSISKYGWSFILCLLCFCVQAQPNWKTLMDAESHYAYYLGNQEPPSEWNTLDFSAENWLVGAGGIGYADGDDNTIIPKVPSVYMRQKFTVNNLLEIKKLVLYADYDDGFVAYLNGVEIARANLEGTPPLHNDATPDFREAEMYNGGLPISFQSFDYQELLIEGENVFAVQTHNYEGLVSSDMTTLYWLLVDTDELDSELDQAPSWFQDSYFESTLSIININTDGIYIPDEPSISGTMDIIARNTNFILDIPNDYSGHITIERRGQTSQFMFPKNGYAIELKDELGNDTDASILGMPEEEDWILHGPYSDKSLMRNVLAMKLARDVGQYASRTRLVELFINGQYEGVYVLMERIKRDKERVDIVKLESSEISGDDLTGGYIVKLDKGPVDWESQFNMVNNPDLKLRFQHVYPKRSQIVTKQREYIKSFIDSMEMALSLESLSFGGKRYDEYLDLESFAEYFLLMELTKNIDAYRISSYYYKDKDSKGGLFTAGPVWDFNISMGNGDYCNTFTSDGWVYDEHCGIFNPFWWGVMFEDHKFRNLVKCKWEEWRNGPIQEELIFGYIDSLSETLELPASRNFARWPILDEYIWPNYQYGGTYLDEVEYVKEFLEDRWEWMDDNLFGTCSVTAIPNVILDDYFQVYPNPTQQYINVNLPDVDKQKFINYRIISMDGSTIREGQLANNARLNTQGLNNGIFLLELNHSHTNLRTRFTKI